MDRTPGLPYVDLLVDESCGLRWLVGSLIGTKRLSPLVHHGAVHYPYETALNCQRKRLENTFTRPRSVL